MTPLSWAMAASLGVALAHLAMTLVNLTRYRRAPALDGAPSAPRPAESTPGDARAELLSVCVPARNEEANIEACVRSILASVGVPLEVLVYDDESADRTPEIVAGLSREDPRVRPIDTVALPEGWNGKQHACWRMSREARGTRLLFTDADVRVEPEALARALLAHRASAAALVSAFPRQITRSLGERLVVPMIFFLLFSYLPMGRMRRTTDPGASAGCGQFLLVDRAAYDASGGHARFPTSMHDGIMLPRTLRRAGFRTDLFDATDLAGVRMYHGLAEAWRGFAKNAYEGIGSVWLLALLTLLNLGGHVLPWAVLLAGALARDLDRPSPGRAAMVLAASAAAAGLVQRALLARRFRQGASVVPLHPFGVVVMTLIQWHSLAIHRRGRRAWRGRRQAAPRPWA